MPIRSLDLLDIPTPAPTRGGLLSVSQVFDAPNNEFTLHREVLQGATCSVPVQAPYDCFTTIPIPDAAKDPNGIFYGDITTFSLYIGVHCYMQGDDTVFAQQARDALAAGESAGVEVVGQDLLNDITQTETATNIVDAIGKAERWAGNNWGHLPLIHMDREQATDAIAQHVAIPGLDWSLTTGMGTPINAAGGFTPQAAIWVTGSASLMRGPISTYRAIHPTQNREMVIAERSYALWIDCGGLKITIA